jgi:oxalate decarboxylase
MTNISRRSVLAATVAGGLAVAATAAQAQTGQTVPMPNRPGAGGTDPGPRDALRDQQNPDIYAPPATDHGTLPNLRFSFSDAHMRLEPAGWTRQVELAPEIRTVG